MVRNTIKISPDEVMLWLEDVKDPEIPILSLPDLGVITDIVVSESGKVCVEISPTFSGCPAMEYMRKEVENTLALHGVSDFEVSIGFRKAWSSDMISLKGRQALKAFGIAAPGEVGSFTDIDLIEQAECPHCKSLDTSLNSIFGPTLCRSIYFCYNCQQSFEQFKSV